MEILSYAPSMSKDRMYCPSTDEVIFAPHYDEIEMFADAMIAFWHDEFTHEPTINATGLEQAWEAVYLKWKAETDPALNIWELLNKFLSEYQNPDWIVYECTFYGMTCGPVSTTMWFVVRKDTVIEEDPDLEDEEEEGAGDQIMETDI